MTSLIKSLETIWTVPIDISLFRFGDSSVCGVKAIFFEQIIFGQSKDLIYSSN